MGLFLKETAHNYKNERQDARYLRKIDSSSNQTYSPRVFSRVSGFPFMLQASVF
ncbi:MAG: Unknown protein [uncultured Thiotrichaceae bacterium]|uniref:Uncharacterized protein n=1 Tax=uncultured Thiotrichaceae bacterium TaxID=298394 RepID=A0A6S6S6U6_9GAMM|nr:MAG: Unknown protein [uncultured Thiotrichaceae bacterium]